jgi:hypothetical protein
MTHVLRAPPVGFEGAVRAHFFLKRDEIRAQAVQWVEEALLLARYQLEALRLEHMHIPRLLRLVKEQLEMAQAQAADAYPTALQTHYRVFERAQLGSGVWPERAADHPGDLIVPTLPRPRDELLAAAGDAAASSRSRGDMMFGGAPVPLEAPSSGMKLTFKAAVRGARQDVDDASLQQMEGALACAGVGGGSATSVADLATQLSDLRRRVVAQSSQSAPTAVDFASASAASATQPPLHSHHPSTSPSALSESSARLTAALATVAATSISSAMAVGAGNGAAGAKAAVGATPIELSGAVSALASAVAAAEQLAATLSGSLGKGALADKVLPSDWDLLCAYSHTCQPFWIAAGMLANSRELFDELDRLSEANCLPASELPAEESAATPPVAGTDGEDAVVL